MFVQEPACDVEVVPQCAVHAALQHAKADARLYGGKLGDGGELGGEIIGPTVLNISCVSASSLAILAHFAASFALSWVISVA